MSSTMIDGGIPLGHRYLLHEVIGRGAMGEVRRATARDTGEEVAARLLRPELAAALVCGPNLRTYLDAAGTLAPSEAVALAVQALHGLAAAHAPGVVHRD